MGGCFDIFALIYPFFPLSPSLWETARYRLKYCLKGPLNPKSTNQQTNTATVINRYYFMGSNSVVFKFSSTVSGGQLLNERICSSTGKFFPINVDPLLKLELHRPGKRIVSHESCCSLPKWWKNILIYPST